MEVSPVKRRVLGALDPNAFASPKVRADGKALLSGKSPVKTPRTGLAFSSRTPEREAEARKRRSPSLGMTSRAEGLGEGEPAAKRPCLEDHAGEDARLGRRADEVCDQSPPSSTSTTRTTATTARHRSASPDSPSVFDTSAADNSQVTILTEPDATGPAPAPTTAAVPPRPRARLTREQAREKAEILRLRLGLASYKVRTNQTDVPLDRLEARPIPASRALSRAGSFSHPQSTTTAPPHPAPVSSSFPGAARPNTTSSSRRQLPSAPVRRDSNSSSGSSNGGGIFASAAGEQQQQRLQQQADNRLARLPGPRHAPNHSHHHAHSQHQRRQSEVVTAAGRRGYVESNGVLPPRPRTATERVMMVDGEEDFEGRGGAASGLLSLARS